MIAIILAGGKSTRMGCEKAILRVKGRRLIDIIATEIEESNSEDFLIATSRNAPKTMKYCMARYKTIETPGRGYHEDVVYLLEIYPEFISASCDIPFLKAEHINVMLDFYDGNSVTGVVYKNGKWVAIGLNIVTKSNLSKDLRFNDPLLGINVNTPDDLKIAEYRFNEK